MPPREADDDEAGHEPHEATELQQPHRHEHQPGEETHERERLGAVVDRDVQQQRDKGGGGAGDVESRAAEDARHCSGEGGGVEPGDRTHAHGDGEGDRQHIAQQLVARHRQP